MKTEAARVGLRAGRRLGLQDYHKKRKFAETPEPRGAEAPEAGRSFVVQKHDATRLHYDFRLEIDGVLVSWAVPKGPSLNPQDKRLAVQTEDHPLDYGGFEGIIPEGNYGAGTVMVWDNGTYEVEGALTAAQQLAKGDIKVRLHGRKLRGGFALVHTGKRATDPKKQKDWLMIKHRDDAVDTAWDIEQHDWSVLTGRTLREIAAREAAQPTSPAELPGAREAPMPRSIDPALACLVDKPFSNPDWLFELKWDGMRVVSFIRDGKCELQSRRGLKATSQFPELAALPQRVSAREAILDGEVVVLDAQGRPDFGMMQQRMNVSAPTAALIAEAPVIYYVFDVLYADGFDLRGAPLIERKQYLKRLLIPEPPVRVSDHVAGQGEDLFKLAKEHGLEGIIGKRADSRYVSGRRPDWVKIKTSLEIDAVVGGFTAPRGGRAHFGALLLGLYEKDGLRFIGAVGSGFTERSADAAWEQLSPLVSIDVPFRSRPMTREQSTFVKSALVARVKFSGWTHENHLRAPVFLGLRNDIDPRDCRAEAETTPAPAPNPEPAPAAPAPSDRARIRAELRDNPAETIHIEVDGRKLRFSHLNKIYFPEPGLAKRDLLLYYLDVADLILPFLRNRPLVLRRMPEGLKGELFYQKDVSTVAPDWATTVPIPTEGKDARYFVANDLASLLFLTNWGSIDHNPWSSQVDALKTPDYVFIDLDPTDDTPFTTVVEVARAVNDVITEIGLRPFLKTSGATGFHIFVPLERIYSFEQVGMFAQIVSRMAGQRVKDLVTWERTVSKRPPGKVLLDYSQIAYSRPLASVYSVRPATEASVSAPVAASELRPALRPEQFTIRTLPDRLKKTGDLWADFFQSKQRLEPALAKLRGG